MIPARAATVHRVAPAPARGLALCLALGLALALLLSPVAVPAEPVAVSSRVLSQFQPGAETTRFGRLEFLGGLQLTSASGALGGWSSIRFLPDRRHFIGVQDDGHWISGAIARDGQGRLSGLAEVSIAPILDAEGRADRGKAFMDAESLALRDGAIYVGFEQRHRIDAYPLAGFETARPRRSLPLPFLPRSLRGNKGLEMLAAAPDGSGARAPVRGQALGGGLVAIAEESLDTQGNFLAAIVDGPQAGRFSLVRRDGFAVTDGAFLPDGDLLVLQRRFTLLGGVAMRILRIPGDRLQPGAVVDGEVLLEADYRFQIDNMEGLDVVVEAPDDIRLILVSDDNRSVLQRSLMLEFRLLP